MTYGVARGMKNFIVITLGTGVGSGIVINGQLVYGCDGFAGELGHTIQVKEGGRSCGCGRFGSFYRRVEYICLHVGRSEEECRRTVCSYRSSS